MRWYFMLWVGLELVSVRNALVAAEDLVRTELFSGLVPRIDLQVSPENIQKLAKDPKVLVECNLAEAGQPVMTQCLIKLKGTFGSFRPITDPRPGFSLRTRKLVDDQYFHGIAKFQLNNCAQDTSFLHELLAGEMARRAGIPASRCTHAYVSLNGRVLGTYVLKEGFDGDFLRAFFDDYRGHLYDGGLHNDISPELECDRGNLADKIKITEFTQALNEPDVVKRRQRLPKVLDIDAYLSHLAMEDILDHVDGYSYRANNYRVYEDPTTGKFVFILHGMDIIFGIDPYYGGGHPRQYVLASPIAAPLYPGASETMVARALWSDKEDQTLRERFRQQALKVYKKAIVGVDWPARALQVAAHAKAQMMSYDPKEAAKFDEHGREAAAQLKTRIGAVQAQYEDVEQLSQPGGQANLAKYFWFYNADRGEALEQGDVSPVIHLKTQGGKAEARLALCLEPGRYQCSVTVNTKRMDQAQLVLRLSGQSDRLALPKLKDNQTAQLLCYDFEVKSTDDPVIVLELKGGQSEAVISKGSLILRRLP
jgi:hypothetical protein